MNNHPLGRPNLLTAAAALLCAVTSSQAADAKKPNIIIIISDDFGYGDAGRSSEPRQNRQFPVIAENLILRTQNVFSGGVNGFSPFVKVSGRSLNEAAASVNVSRRSRNGGAGALNEATGGATVSTRRLNLSAPSVSVFSAAGNGFFLRKSHLPAILLLSRNDSGDFNQPSLLEN